MNTNSRYEAQCEHGNFTLINIQNAMLKSSSALRWILKNSCWIYFPITWALCRLLWLCLGLGSSSNLLLVSLASFWISCNLCHLWMNNFGLFLTSSQWSWPEPRANMKPPKTTWPKGRSEKIKNLVNLLSSRFCSKSKLLLIHHVVSNYCTI